MRNTMSICKICNEEILATDNSCEKQEFGLVHSVCYEEAVFKHRG